MAQRMTAYAPRYSSAFGALAGGASAGWQGADAQQRAVRAAAAKAALDAALKEQIARVASQGRLDVANVGATSREGIAGGFYNPATGEWVPGRNVNQATQIANTQDYRTHQIAERTGRELSTGNLTPLGLNFGLQSVGKAPLPLPPPVQVRPAGTDDNGDPTPPVMAAPDFLGAAVKARQQSVQNQWDANHGYNGVEGQVPGRLETAATQTNQNGQKAVLTGYNDLFKNAGVLAANPSLGTSFGNYLGGMAQRSLPGSAYTSVAPNMSKPLVPSAKEKAVTRFYDTNSALAPKKLALDTWAKQQSAAVQARALQLKAQGLTDQQARTRILQENAKTAAAAQQTRSWQAHNPATGASSKPFSETSPQYQTLAKEKTANNARLTQIGLYLNGQVKDSAGAVIKIDKTTGGSLRNEQASLQQRNSQIDRVLSGGAVAPAPKAAYRPAPLHHSATQPRHAPTGRFVKPAHGGPVKSGRTKSGTVYHIVP